MLSLRYSLANKIKTIRKLRKISQERLAELIGLSHRQFTRIESGGSFPSPETIEKIAYYLNVEIKELFDVEIDKEAKIRLLTGTDDNVSFKVSRTHSNLIEFEPLNTLSNIAKFQNKTVNPELLDESIFEMAVLLNKPITIEDYSNGQSLKVIVYFPDHTYKIIKDTEVEKREEYFKQLSARLETICESPKKLKFIQLAMSALENPQALEHLKICIEGIELAND